MNFVDMHCDTLYEAYFAGKGDVYDFSQAMLDVKRMKESNTMAQFFAIFMPPEDKMPKQLDDNEYIESCLKIFRTTAQRHSNVFEYAFCGEDIQQNNKNGKTSGFLTLEDGRAVNGETENLKKYYDTGIRLITLTWNHENCFGSPHSVDRLTMEKGLTDFGREAVACMNELGIIIDVSHLSDGGFWDVVKLSKKPFAATHSNCRALSPHTRNMTDDMIKALAEKGGVIGLNFYPCFLNRDIECTKGTAELLFRHAKHMINTGGIDCVAIGSDFDGFTGENEISGVEKMHLLFECLHKNGLSYDEVEKIAWKNAMRLLNELNKS